MTDKLSYEEVTSSMVTLDSVKLLILSSILMGNQVLMGDINHACIQAKTKELVYTIAGPEFGPLQGQVFSIDKALH